MAEEKQETIDFAYAIDCTGSMSSYITQTKKDIQHIVDQMKNEFPAFKLRLACVAYRDWCDDVRLESQSFTENVDTFKNYVGNLKAYGGGDAAEDVLGGLNYAANLAWNSKLRILFHICDAPPHNKMYHDISSDDYPKGHPSDPANYHEVVIKKLKAKNIHLCIAKLRADCDKMINVFQGYATSIGLTMEERNVQNASQLLDAVKKTLVVLAKMRKEIRHTEDEMTNITSSMKNLKYDTEEFVKQTEIKLDAMQNDITGVTGQLDKVDIALKDIKREYDGLSSDHSMIMAYIQNITVDDVEKAEEKVVGLSEKLCDVNQKYLAEQGKLNAAWDDLTKKDEDVRETEKAVNDKTKQKNAMRTQISALTKKLKNMDKSESRHDLLSEIEGKLKEIRKLFVADTEMKKKIRAIKKEIVKAFNEANERRRHINECKRDVESKLNELDDALDTLDERLS